jgi:amidase
MRFEYLQLTGDGATGELPSLLNINLEEVAEGLENGRFTSVDIVKAYIARIEESNEEFRSVIEINPDAVRAAELLDEERHRSGSRGRVHDYGILYEINLY